MIDPGRPSNSMNPASIAAIDYVEVCCQQTAYMAGRGTISDEIAAYVIGALCRFNLLNVYVGAYEFTYMYVKNLYFLRPDSTSPQPSIVCNGSDAAAHCLRLPGKSLHLTPLLKAKRFRNFVYKTGALKAFQELQLAQLGSLEEIGAGKGTQTVSLCMCKITIIYIYTCTCMYAYYIHIHVLMRDEKEGRKEGRSKQGQAHNKAKQHSTPMAVTVQC